MDHSQPRKGKGEFYAGEVGLRLKGAESKRASVWLCDEQTEGKPGLLIIRAIVGKSSPSGPKERLEVTIRLRWKDIC